MALLHMTTAAASSAAQTERNILAALEEHGSWLTFPRREVATLIARWGGSFSAAEVIAGLPTLGRATVYRTLRLFVDAGILHKTALLDGSPRYWLGRARRHHCLVCVSCGRIDEFGHPSIDRMLRTLAQQAGGIVGHRLHLYHRCPGCIGSTGASPSTSVDRVARRAYRTAPTGALLPR